MQEVLLPPELPEPDEAAEQPDHHMHALPSESVVMAQVELFVGEKQGDCAK